jgi:hypothetical protein
MSPSGRERAAKDATDLGIDELHDGLLELLEVHGVLGGRSV